jgi:hypothetical protein
MPATSGLALVQRPQGVSPRGLPPGVTPWRLTPPSGPQTPVAR